ncbi:MAG: aminotransferase class V-fold PLP-dependent enzyme [Clostridia bacterium]|nr:aminotransferase class V-fold PLP-dependent enzyme [Clostridia bacterium]
MIYLDNAATSGIKPSRVIGAVEYALKKYSANPGRSGHRLSMNAALAVYNAREKIKEMFGATQVENVAFTLNCTHALNCVIKGALSYGDHVIVSDLEHNAVMRPLEKLKNEGKITYTVAKSVENDDNATLENFKNCITTNTKLIICTHASNVFGCVMPIEKIGNLCKEYGLFFAVDAAQSAGVLEIDMQKMHIDYLCIAAHKGLFAPMGTGVLIAEKPLKHTVLEGGTGTDSFNLEQPTVMPEMLESGTINLPGICGISAGVDFIKTRGIRNIYLHEFNLCKYLFEQLSSCKNIQLYNKDFELFKKVPVLSFNVLGYDSNEISMRLNEYGIAVRSGFHCAPSAHIKYGTDKQGTVRVSPGILTKREDIDYLLKILKIF